jgi:tetratricopeptide (TPR) repeat protein
MIKQFYVFILLLAFLNLNGQQGRLADIYFNDGEFEKAASIYKASYESNKQMTVYFQKYIDCLVALKDFELAEKTITAEFKNRPNDATLLIMQANMLTALGQEDKAKKLYEQAVKKVGNDLTQVENVARSFINQTLYEYAAEVYEIATLKAGDKKLYAYTLADIYRRLGKTDKMVEYYVASIETFAGNTNYLKQIFERFLSDEEIAALQVKLYDEVQKNQNNIPAYEILEWSLLFQKQYKKALRQARALDAQLDENGARVYNIASISYADRDYDTAIDGFTYIVDNMSPNSSFYLDAKRNLLNARRDKIVNGFNYSPQDLQILRDEYVGFLDEYGRNTKTAPLMVEYADFEGLYINDIDSAKNILLQVLTFGGLQATEIAAAKLKLADYYLIEGDRWESSLLYSQVDKSFKEGILGEQARYKNAKLSYFTGDFEWAQQQFDILKSATSRLISNDAIDLSVFIMDNLNLDTTKVPLEMFATAELLIFQNKLEEALSTLTKLGEKYPEHSLMDDILFTKAQIFKKKLQLDSVVALYQVIIEKYPTEIKGDNAMYDLAWLYETSLGKKEKAQELYFKLFTDFASSTFAIDARKRYRLLRGDSL